MTPARWVDTESGVYAALQTENWRCEGPTTKQEPASHVLPLELTPVRLRALLMAARKMAPTRVPSTGLDLSPR